MWVLVDEWREGLFVVSKGEKGKGKQIVAFLMDSSQEVHFYIQ
jgi:hypothetical protein